MRLAIIGGNLVALSLAHQISDELGTSVNILLVDERAETGFPSSGSGLISSSKNVELLIGWSPIEEERIQRAVNESLALPIGWLEKNLALSLVQRQDIDNVQISLRTECTIVSPTSLSLQGAGEFNEVWNGDAIIDCRGQPASDSLKGALRISPIGISNLRTDGLWECWADNSESLTEDGQAIELLTGHSNLVDEMNIDAALASARGLFEQFIMEISEKGSSKPENRVGGR